MRSRSARVVLAMAAGLAGLIGLALSPCAVASGDRLVVNVPEPYEVGGKVHPAGPLAVRHLGDFSPTTKIDQLTAESGCLGILLAERRPREEGGLLSAALVFTRSPRGHLVLVGYTTGDSPAGRLYLYRDSGLGETPASPALMASR
jgi:hypothetical protein